MAYDFPSNPANGQTSNGYTWNGYAWLPPVVAIDGSVTLIADTPPANPAQGQTWWESDTGGHFINYDDGTSRQWVQLNGAKPGPAGPAVSDGDKGEVIVSGNGTTWLLDRATNLAPFKVTIAGRTGVTLEDRFGRYIDAKEYGVLGDGNDYSTQLLAALTAASAANAGLLVRGTNAVSTSLTLGNKSNVRMFGDGPDDTIFLHRVAGNNLISTVGVGVLTGSATLAPGIIGAYTLAVPSTGLSVNDYVVIQDDSQNFLDRGAGAGVTAGKYGQIARVKSIDSASQITLRSNLEFAYATGTLVRKLSGTSKTSYHDFSITNDIGGDGSNANGRGISMFYGTDFEVRNVTFRRMYDDGLYLRYMVDGLIKDVVGTDFITNPQTGTPYLVIATQGCSNILVQSLRQRWGRHAFTTGSSTTDIAAQFIHVVDGLATEMTETAWDVHPGAYKVSFTNCRAHGYQLGANPTTGHGFQLRGYNCSVQGGRVDGAAIGALVVSGQDCTIDGLIAEKCDIGVQIHAAPGTIVKNLISRDTRTNIVSVINTIGAANFTGVKISDVTAYGNPSGTMIDFAVWDDTFAVERIDTPNVTGTKWSAAIPRGHLYGAQMADIAKFESLPRSVVGNGTLGAHTSGGLFLTAVPMKRGEKITTLTFVVAAAPTAQTNLWLALYDRNLNLLGVTNDMTTTAPIAGGTVTGTLATPYVTKYEGLYYVGIVQVATTVSTVRGNQTTSNLNYTPRLSGASTAGLTTPGTAPNPAATMASTAIIPWVAVG